MSTVSLHWREKNVHTAVKKAVAASLIREMAGYLVEMPLAAMCALWIICLPLMYFALYGDIGRSISTLGEMTVTFMAFLMVFLAFVVSACMIASYLAHFLLKFRWRKLDSVR